MSDWRKGMSRKMRADDGPTWTGTEARRREVLLRQFVKGDGPRGNSESFQEGWDRIFGKGGKT